VPAEIALGLHATAAYGRGLGRGRAVSLLGALSIAELAAAMPEAVADSSTCAKPSARSGDALRLANGIVINPASIAAIAVGFAGYMGHFVPLSDWGIKWVAIASIIGLTVLNTLGVRAGATTQNVLTLIKMPRSSV